MFYSDEAPDLLKHLLDAGVSIEVTNEKEETLLMVAPWLCAVCENAAGC